MKPSFTPYSEKQKKNWGNSRSIVICETEKQIRKFVSDARKGTNIGKKMYLGAIPASLAETIRIEPGLNVEGYNCSVAAQEIRKIFKDHGNEQTENLREQRTITEYDFVNIPVVIQSPDKITRSERDYNGRPVINFVKLLEGKVTVTAYVSGKHLALTVQTLFAGIKIGTLPRRQVNKLLSIRPKRTAVQFLITVYPLLPKKARVKLRHPL